MNLNKLFPRLPIKWKLAIAFVSLAGVPLVLVAVLGTFSAIRELRSSARAELLHDVSLAERGASRSLREVGQHVQFLAAGSFGSLAGAPYGPERESALEEARRYLEHDPSALIRVKLVDVDGVRVATVNAPSTPFAEPPEGGVEPLYHWIAEGMGEGDLIFVPVELSRDASDLEVFASVAVVLPLFEGGTFVGSLVGEADASMMFASLDDASPGLEGETALVGPDGLYLYHSRFKSDWASLLNREEVRLTSELPEDVAREVLSGKELVEAGGGVEIATARLSMGIPGEEGFILYRSVPLGALYARVADFLGMISLAGVFLVLGVAGLSVVAAGQITRPILRLQTAAHELAQGGEPQPLLVETNDELEDLAEDFNLMAQTLARHRANLEGLVEERTATLKQTQAQLTQILTSSADAIVGLDPEGRILFWNQGAEGLFGFSSDEVVGSPVGSVLRWEDGENVAEARYLESSLMSFGAVVNYRTRRRAKDGSAIPVTLTKTALRDDHGGLVGYSLILRDDRTREHLEEQMRRSERLSAISVMAAGLAHELNNPLSVIGNRIELMQREAMARHGDMQLLKDLDVLRKHVGRIGSITGDLLRFAREDGDGLARVDVGGVVERVMRLIHRVFVAADVELTATVEPRLPGALANENIVETILVNLLLNAKQATPAGGRVEVWVGVSEESGVTIEVRDTGPGVPDELRRRIFEPFFTTKADRGGTGLGLAVCRALVDRLGGTLEVGNREGGGAVFTLHLSQDVHTAVSA